MIKVRDQKIDEAVFMKMREQELAAWPTGKEVDLIQLGMSGSRMHSVLRMEKKFSAIALS